MRFEILSSFMDRLSRDLVPGNAVSVYRGGRCVFRYASGMNDVENRVPMTGDERFNIYSCSKLATVVSALQLYERGFFLLDDPLYEFIPEWKYARVRVQGGDTVPVSVPVTMRHLFTMTAGLNYDTACAAIRRAVKDTDGRADTLVVARYLAQEPLDFEPGSQWQYSLCHDVLAAAVEAISGRRFGTYVKENLFDPLGITTAAYHVPESELPGVACQYRFENGEPADPAERRHVPGVTGHLQRTDKAVSYRFGTGYDSGGAGITVSVDDYARFLAALAHGGSSANGERLLSPGTVALMAQDALTPEQKGYFNWRQLRGCGYGLGVRTTVSRSEAGYNGPAGSFEFGWGGAAGATAIVDTACDAACFYAHHMLNQQEEYYQPRLRNAFYASLY